MFDSHGGWGGGRDEPENYNSAGYEWWACITSSWVTVSMDLSKINHAEKTC